METNKKYNIKVIGTYIIIALLIIFFAMGSILEDRGYSNLYDDYVTIFMEVTQNIAEYDKYDLYSSDVNTETQLKNIFEGFGFYNHSNISKVTRLSAILSEIDKKVTIGSGRKSSYKKLVDAQSCLESIKSMSERYRKSKGDSNVKSDRDTLSNDRLQIMIMRDTIMRK